VYKAKAVKRWFLCNECHQKCETYDMIRPINDCSKCGCGMFTQTTQGGKYEAEESPFGRSDAELISVKQANYYD
jgi:hypothetical protein